MTSDRRVLLFTGEGKGKTTAALGMVLRAAGHAMRVLVVQFVKNDATVGEVAACSALPGVEIVQTGRGFIPPADSPRFADHRAAAEEGLRLAAEAIAARRFDLLVLDEICNAVAKGLVAEEGVIRIVQSAPDELVVVLTGRDATPGLLDLADTATEMRCLKHGYAAGHPARKGVEC